MPWIGGHVPRAVEESAQRRQALPAIIRLPAFLTMLFQRLANQIGLRAAQGVCLAVQPDGQRLRHSYRKRFHAANGLHPRQICKTIAIPGKLRQLVGTSYGETGVSPTRPAKLDWRASKVQNSFAPMSLAAATCKTSSVRQPTIGVWLRAAASASTITRCQSPPRATSNPAAQSPSTSCQAA